MIYDDGSVFIYNEYTENISQVNTSVLPWSNAGNLTPDTKIFNFHDLNTFYVYHHVYTFQNCSGYTAKCIVRPQNKFAAWINTEGDIIIFRNGNVTKIFKPSTDYEYIDLNVDSYDQKY